MILSLIRNGFSMEMLIGVLASVFVVFCTLPIHEFAHALAATKLGDETARLNGRLTLNPLAHLDLLGCVMILLVGFGWAKPVPVNMRRFKNPKAGMAITALAGPVANLIMALFFLLIRVIVLIFLGDTTFSEVANYFFYYAASINVSLAVFNLLPIPPLDGSRIATVLIPNKYYYKIMQYERYIMIGLFLLILTGVLTTPLSYLSSAVMKGFIWLTALPFSALF